ncbi:MAG: hypothetical protein EOO22_16555 [Comamonadaceae bacterium]|nr:MAG: hypothetical protein EOO22_16555 [Comamonadaceae bacterium]
MLRFDGSPDPVERVAPSPVPATLAPAVAAEPLVRSDGTGERIRAMKREVEALDPVQRQVWVDLALQTLAAKGMMTAVVSRRASQGDVLHGVLGSVLVHAYASATYGADWNTPRLEPTGNSASQ